MVPSMQKKEPTPKQLGLAAPKRPSAPAAMDACFSAGPGAYGMWT